MGVCLFLPAFVRARAHVSVLSLREKVEDSGVGGGFFCLYQDELVLLREMVGQWAWGAIFSTGLVRAGRAAYGSYAVEPCLELGVCWGAEPCVCLKP